MTSRRLRATVPPRAVADSTRPQGTREGRSWVPEGLGVDLCAAGAVRAIGILRLVDD